MGGYDVRAVNQRDPLGDGIPPAPLPSAEVSGEVVQTFPPPFTRTPRIERQDPYAEDTPPLSEGIRRVAIDCRRVFGDAAPVVLRKWFENDGDRRWLVAAEYLEAGVPEHTTRA